MEGNRACLATLHEIIKYILCAVGYTSALVIGLADMGGQAEFAGSVVPKIADMGEHIGRVRRAGAAAPPGCTLAAGLLVVVKTHQVCFAG